MSLTALSRTADTDLALRHLEILQRLLRRDYLTRADLPFALHDLARMAQEALDARAALVALWDPGTATWSACTSLGERLGDQEISTFGSRSVLDAVRASGEPLLTGPDMPLELRSDSLLTHGVAHVLAVPLRFWDVRVPRPVRELGGCLYADRRLADEPFTDRDVDLVLDICRLAEPNLNLLRHLARVETRLEASREELEELRQAVETRYRLGESETRDPWFAKHVLIPLERVCHADKVGILFLGPTGAGKTHLARAFHHVGARRAGPFIIPDCTQVTFAETLAAELFGYAPRSGYVNAPPQGRPGKAELADGGTLFIDEVATLPMTLQQQLLRLIEEGRFSRLGSGESQVVDIQVLTATNADLRQFVEDGGFREDLYWRLAEMTIQVPPLDRRPADVPRLAQTFLEQARQRVGRDGPLDFSPAALRKLLRHRWSRSGNLRGLQHTIHRSVLLAPPEARVLEAEQIEIEEAFPGPRGAKDPAGAMPESPASPARLAKPPSASAGSSVAALLHAKIDEHRGNVAAMARDEAVSRALGYHRGSIPASTLAGRLEGLGLKAQLERARGDQGPPLAAIIAAIERHGSAMRAAEALGVRRDAVVWRLRREGLSIRQIRRGAPGPGEPERV